MRNTNVIHNALVFSETRHSGMPRCRLVSSAQCPLNMGHCFCREDVGLCTRFGKKSGAVACICHLDGEPVAADDVREWSRVVMNKFGGKSMLDALIKQLEVKVL